MLISKAWPIVHAGPPAPPPLLHLPCKSMYWHDGESYSVSFISVGHPSLSYLGQPKDMWVTSSTLIVQMCWIYRLRCIANHKYIQNYAQLTHSI